MVEPFAVMDQSYGLHCRLFLSSVCLQSADTCVISVACVNW